MWLKIKKNGIYLGVCLLILTIASCATPKKLTPPFYKTEDSVVALEKIDDFGQVTAQIDGEPLHLVYAGNKSAPVILFVHGSPGDWKAWAGYLDDPQLRERAFMIAMDRPGYGGSDNGISPHSLETQARYIIEATRDLVPDQTQFIVVGHSYGGPVALQLAADYPDRITSTILLAPAISPDLVGARWYNHVASLWVTRPFLPTPVKRSNDEMKMLNSELLKLQPRLGTIQAPTTVIQGQKDWIVLPGNADFAKEKLVSSNVDIQILPDSSHFIPWQDYDVIKAAILDHLEN